MTLDALAAEAGISASHLSRLERSQTLPSFTVLAKIAEVLGVNVDDFVRLERDVTLLDTELHRYLDLLDVRHPVRDEIFELSIEARRSLVSQLRQLGDALVTPRATQEAARRMLAEHDVPEVWKALNRLVRQSGMGGPAFMRGWMRVIETPGPRLALIADRSFFMLPPEADLLRAYRSVFAEAPLDPMVAAWWETSDSLRDPSVLRRWPVRMVVRRSLVDEARDCGQLVPGVELGADAVRRLLGRLVDRLEQDPQFELALSDTELGPFNFLFANDVTGILERPLERRPRETAPRVGVWLNGSEVARGFIARVNGIWDELPAADKDREAVIGWLRGRLDDPAA